LREAYAAHSQRYRPSFRFASASTSVITIERTELFSQTPAPSNGPLPPVHLVGVVRIAVRELLEELAYAQLRRGVETLLVEQILELVDPALAARPRHRRAARVAEVGRVIGVAKAENSGH